MTSCAESVTIQTALAPCPYHLKRHLLQEHREHKERSEQIEHAPERQPIMVPATYTAFTSRIGLPSYNESELATLTNTLTDSLTLTSPSVASIAIPVPRAGQPQIGHHSTSDDDSGSSDDCAIDDDDDDDSDWEDEDDVRQRVLDFTRIANPPTRSLASNLSLLLRQAQAQADKSGGAGSSSVEPFNTGRTTLPDPLRCHPGLTAASLTPGNTMSPPMPPPPPPSSPCDTVPLPAVPVPATATAATSAAPSVSGASFTSASSVDWAASTASPSSASSSDGSTRGESRSRSSRGSRAASPIMHIDQLSALHAPLYHQGSLLSIIDNNGDPLLAMPFNGGLGPRAVPIIRLGPPTAHGPARRVICSGSSLLGSEMTRSLRTSIMDENNSRYVFKHYGSRRYVDENEDDEEKEEEDDEDTAAEEVPPFRRTQSAPNIPSTSRKSVPCMAGSKPSRRICYVDDYVAPKSWNWGMDYHSHGW